MRRIGHYFKLLLVFLRVSLLAQLEYRLNFVASLFVESAYLCIKLSYLVVIINTGVSLGPLSSETAVIFIGQYIFMTGIWMFLGGVNSLPQKITTGALDFYIIKPGKLWFLQAFGGFNFGLAIPNILAGAVIVCAGWIYAGIPLTLAASFEWLLFTLSGIALTFAAASMCALLAFWFTSMTGAYTLFAALWDFNVVPMTIYPRSIKTIGTFVLPVFLLTNWPGLAVSGNLGLTEAAWGFVCPCIALILTAAMWRRGLNRYNSANG